MKAVKRSWRTMTEEQKRPFMTESKQARQEYEVKRRKFEADKRELQAQEGEPPE